MPGLFAAAGNVSVDHTHRSSTPEGAEIGTTVRGAASAGALLAPNSAIIPPQLEPNAPMRSRSISSGRVRANA